MIDNETVLTIIFFVVVIFEIGRAIGREQERSK